MKLPIAFRLQYSARHDEQAKAVVAYIPLLRLFAQAKTEEQIGKAVQDLVINFITICHERGILTQVMQERGLRRAEVKHATNKTDEQFIMLGKVDQEVYEVPITLLAGKQALAECHNC